jgi:hypothetical protein
MGGIWFFTTNCHIAREMWQGILSWCRIQHFHYFFVHFCWMVPLKHSELQYKKQNLLFVLQGPTHSTLHPSCWIKWMRPNGLQPFFLGGGVEACWCVIQTTEVSSENHRQRCKLSYSH